MCLVCDINFRRKINARPYICCPHFDAGDATVPLNSNIHGTAPTVRLVELFPAIDRSNSPTHNHQPDTHNALGELHIQPQQQEQQLLRQGEHKLREKDDQPQSDQQQQQQQQPEETQQEETQQERRGDKQEEERPTHRNLQQATTNLGGSAAGPVTDASTSGTTSASSGFGAGAAGSTSDPLFGQPNARSSGFSFDGFNFGFGGLLVGACVVQHGHVDVATLRCSTAMLK